MPTEKLTDGTVVEYGADGAVVRQQLSDGTVFDSFDAGGHPLHGVIAGSGEVTIDYRPDGSSTWSYADGTSVGRSADGDVVRQETADGAVFDRFDTDGRPTHGTLPGADGGPAQQVSVSYGGDGSSTWSYADGSRVSRDADGDVVRQSTGDGAVFDRFDADGRPTHGTLPDADGGAAQQVSVSYGDDGSSTWSYADGSRVSRDADGDVVRQGTADGAVFDRFDADGRPTHGTLPGADGGPAQQVSVSYRDDGSSTWSYADGSRVSRDADGDVTRQGTADGAVFDRFDADGRPTHGTLPDADGGAAQQVSVSYDGDGSSTWSYADGSRVSRDADGDVTGQSTADGASFDRFDADGRPTHGSLPGADGGAAQQVSVSYGDDGSSTWSYADGSRVSRDADGDVIRQTTADGAVFDRFDGDGRPTHGTLPGTDGGPAQQVSVSYGGDGSSTWSYADGSRVSRDADGDVIRQTTADGAVFDRFDADGRPTHGSLPGADGGPAQQVSVSYSNDGSSTWSYADGSRVSRDADGDVVRQSTADGASFDRFNADGRPTHGSLPGADGGPAQQVSVSYSDDGSSTWSYADGSRVSRDADGDVTRQSTGDGAVFDRFDADGRPTHGALPGAGGGAAQQVSVSYDGDGSSTWSYADGSRVSRDADGDVIRQTTGDGAVFDRFDADGRPTHGTLPGTDGGPAQQVSVSYSDDGSSTWSYADGSRVSRDADGDVVRQTTGDGAVFDRFDADGRPTHGALPGADGGPAQQVSVSYDGDGSSTWSYADGSRVSRDADGDVVRQTTGDGAVFDRFDADGRPTHGTLPGADGGAAQQVSVSYGDDGSSTWSYADGSRVSRDADGDVIRQTTGDGAVFDRFDADGRPTHGTLPGADGGPAQQVSVSYGDDGSSIWSYADGTSVARDADGDVTRQSTADGAVFDRFDGDGRPTHGTLPGADGGPAQQVSVSYGDDGSSTWSYADGTRVSRNADGDVVDQTTGDGASFDAFTEDGKPTHGTLPGADGGPAQQVSVSYDGDGSSTWSYGDGTRVDRAADGDVERQVTADGASFDAFDGNGRPTHGTVNGQQVGISYSDGGGSTWSFSDGTTVERNSAGEVVRQTTADGASFDAFTGDGKPTHGTVGGQTVDISYGADGGSVWAYDGDGTKVYRGPDGVVTRQELADGSVFDQFDADGAPVHGVVGGQTVDIEQKGGGASVWTYESDGTQVHRDPDGEVTKQVLADGTVYDKFDGDGRPLHGTIPAGDGRPPQTVSIGYGADGSSTWSYGDGTTVTHNGQGDVTRLSSDGWTFDQFDANGAPTAGKEDGTGNTVTIVNAEDGGSVWTYSDGTVVTRNADGDVETMQSNGWTYDEFTADGKPTHGYDSKGTAVEIQYKADGITESTFSDGTVVGTDQDGNPVYQIVNGEKAEYAVEIPKLGAAIKTIEGRRDLIEGDLHTLKSYFENAIGSVWVSPSGAKYQELAKDMGKLAADTKGLLDDAILAMQKSYDNYVGAESTNTKNMTSA